MDLDTYCAGAKHGTMTGPNIFFPFSPVVKFFFSRVILHDVSVMFKQGKKAQTWLALGHVLIVDHRIVTMIY